MSSPLAEQSVSPNGPETTNKGQEHDPSTQDDKLDRSISSSDTEKEDQPSNHNGGLASAPNEKSEAPKGPPGLPPGVSPPPNGGLVAWLQVLGSWMLFFNTWGILSEYRPILTSADAAMYSLANTTATSSIYPCCSTTQTLLTILSIDTFGIYQTYYESGTLFHETSSNISWIGAVQAMLVLLVGTLVGPYYDRGYFRTLLILGTFGVVFGHMMLSLCHTFWQVILAQGMVIGLGAGCLFVPAVAIMPGYFTSKLGLAIGLAASGSSTGGIIYPITFYRLIDQIGFAWSVRVLGFMALATLMIPLAVMKMRVKPAKARDLIDWSAFRDVKYMTFIGGALIGYIGLYVGFFYISFYGQQKGITNDAMSFYIVPILNAGSVFGRTLPNWLSDYTGPMNIIVPGAFMTGIVLLLMLAVASSAAGLIVLAVLLGFFSGIYIALPPVIFVSLTPDKSKIGTRIGMGMGMLAFGVLAGGPGAGGILQKAGPTGPLDWTGTWVYGGICTVASGVIFIGVRVMKGGFKWTKV